MVTDGKVKKKGKKKTSCRTTTISVFSGLHEEVQINFE